MQNYINIHDGAAFSQFTESLQFLLHQAFARDFKTIVFLCIGTDRSTGDSLGPLVGHKLSGAQDINAAVYGSLSNPVHAKNLTEITNKIYRQCEKPYIVAIDACLGSMEHVGYISIGDGSIKPGSGVNKNLPPVGDAYITGIVNFGGFMDFLILQNTRLDIVMRMADLINTGIRYVLWKLEKDSVFSKVASIKEPVFQPALNNSFCDGAGI